MISYTKGGNILLTRGLPDIPPEDVEKFKKESFDSFCKVSAPKIIKEVYVPSLNKYLSTTGLMVELEDVKVERQAPLPIKYCNQRTSQEAIRETRTSSTMCIYGKFSLHAIDDKSRDFSLINKSAEYVELCRIPYVNDEGLIIYDRFDGPTGIYKKHAYNYIQQVELLPSISYGNDNEITIRCASGKSLSFYLNGAGSLHVRTNKRTHYPFANIIGYRGFKEAMETKISRRDFDRLRDELCDFVHYYGLTRCCESSIVKASGKSVSIDATQLMTAMNDFLEPNGLFRANELRGTLNEYLSLYRAEGLITAYDVQDAEGNVVVPKGVMLSREDITRIYQHDIFKLHVVQERPTSVCLEDNIVVRYIPIGTKNSPMLKRYLPEEKGMYISKDYLLDAEDAISFRSGTVINETIWQFLLDVGYDLPIRAKNSKSSRNVYNLYLNREIISNFFKPAGDDYEDWVYVGPYGNGGDTESFTFGDMFAIYSFFPQVLTHLHDGWLPDADACFIKHFTTIDQSFSKALKDTSLAFFKTYTHYIRHFKEEPTSLLKADTVDNCTFPAYALFMRKLNEYKCLELVDEKAYVNPLAYESAKHKANVYVGNKHAISDKQREMALTSYGRFDSYEVPQSGRLGIVNYLTQSCKQTADGIPMVCYYPIEGKRVRMDKPTWLTAQQEACYIITDIGNLRLNGDVITNDMEEIVNCRVPSVGIAKSTIEPQKLKSVQYVNADPDCTLGYTCGSIPFSCSNDAIRATFAVAQIKEAKPTQHMEPPGVTTTIMSKLEKKRNPFCVRADRDGCIISADSTECSTRGYELKCVTGGTAHEKGRSIFSYYGWADLGGAESLTRLRLVHKPGIPYKKGDILCSSEFVNEDGLIQVGTETCVAYIPDTGYNYEDGVSITKAFAERTRSLSVHSEVVYIGKEPPEFVYQPHRYYKRDDTIEIKRKGRSTPKYHTLSESGYYYDSKCEKRGGIFTYTIYLLSNENSDIGDKFSDRDGNKGVCTHIFTNNENYTLANGYPIEVARNPLGVATRLNIGQLRECRVGWAWKILGARIEIQNFSHDARDVDLLVNFAYDLANSDSAEQAVSKYRSIFPKDLIDLGIERYEYAQNWRGVFNTDGSCDIYFNGEKRPTKVYAGFVYMLKLVQEVRSKISYRAGEAEGEVYMAKTNAPTKGRKSGGGQRLGSMEVAAYCAYGAEAWLNEMFKYRSDDGSGRLAFAMDKYYGDKSYYSKMTQRRAVTSFVVMLASLGIDLTCTEREFIDALALQHIDKLAYPKLNSLREDRAFIPFNRTRPKKNQLQEDVYDKNFATEAEMAAYDYIPAYLESMGEDINDLSEKAYNFIIAVHNGDKDAADRYLRTLRKVVPAE